MTSHSPKMEAKTKLRLVPEQPPAPKPFLRWAGSKRKLLHELIPYWSNKHVRYIEPFMGSACLFFSLAPVKAVLGDLNEDLVETFLSVRDHPEAVYYALTQIRRGKVSYNRVRKASKEGTTAIVRSARFIFLNRYCFNGLYRTNAAGRFNVPYSPSKTGTLPSLNEFCVASAALTCADIRCGDFSTVLKDISPGDFVYLDPPFAVANRRIFRQYGPSSFGTDDLKRLASLLKTIDGLGADFVVSYALCRESLQAFSNWNIRRVRIQRNISGFAEHRREATEIIASNIIPSSDLDT